MSPVFKLISVRQYAVNEGTQTRRPAVELPHNRVTLPTGDTLIRTHVGDKVRTSLHPEAGVITNDMKTVMPGKIGTCLVLGTKRLYDFVDNNPGVEFQTSDIMNNPHIIAQNYKMTSINSALQVDITGQVSADSIGYSLYSGVGGQVDFVRGASRSKDGKAIIALPATAKNGTVSRIVAFLDPGGGVVTSRADVHYVVTEYGIADLFGKSVRRRARELINIAHPSFRGTLEKECNRIKWLQRLPQSG